MRHRVHDTVRPRRVARSLGRALSESGLDRSPGACLDIAGRIYGYPDFASLEADAGNGPPDTDDRGAGPLVAARRRDHQISVLAAEGLDPGRAAEVLDELRPTAPAGPRPLGRDAPSRAARTPSGVRRALARAAAEVARNGEGVTFAEGSGPDGAWHGMSGTMPGRGGGPFAIVVEARGDWVAASPAADADIRTLAATAGRKPGRRDLSAVLSRIGFPAAPPFGPDDRAPSSMQARRLLLRLDTRVLCMMRTLPSQSCATYGVLRSLPETPGGARDLIGRVPLLAGFAADHADIVGLGFPDAVGSVFADMGNGASAFLRGHMPCEPPELREVERVLGALEGFDPPLGHRITTAALRHLAALPTHAVPATAAQAEAMFECVDALLRFEEAGMPLGQLYAGLTGNDWPGLAETVASHGDGAAGLPLLFRLSAAVHACTGPYEEIARDLLSRLVGSRGEDLRTDAAEAMVSALARRAERLALPGRDLATHLAAAIAYRGTGGESLYRGQGLLPSEARGLDAASVLKALGYEPDGLASHLAEGRTPSFGVDGLPVEPRRGWGGIRATAGGAGRPA